MRLSAIGKGLVLWAFVLARATAEESCSGMTEDFAAFATVDVADLLPETGDVGRERIMRAQMVYESLPSAMRILQASGRCPGIFDGPALCGVDEGTLIEPEPGVSLVAWGSDYSARALRVTIRLASDLRRGLPGRTWSTGGGSDANGFIGFCAGPRNPIVSVHVSGIDVSLFNLRQRIDPRGRLMDLPANADVDTKAQALMVAFQLAVKDLQRRTSVLRRPQWLIEKYTRLLGLPSGTSFAELGNAVVRDGRYRDSFVADMMRINAALDAVIDDTVATLRSIRDRGLTSIGYQPRRFDPSDLVTVGSNPEELSFSSNDVLPISVIGSDEVQVSPISFKLLAMPDLLGGTPDATPENVVKACAGTGPCNFPQPYDLLPRQLHLVWESSLLSPQQVADIVEQDGYEMKLMINGVPVEFGPKINYYADPITDQGAWAVNSAHYLHCSSAPPNSCFSTVLITSKTLLNIPFPWVIELKVNQLTELPEPVLIGFEDGHFVFATHSSDLIGSAAVTVHEYPGPAAHFSYFEALMAPTFQSGRCESCHAFETVGALQSPTPHIDVPVAVEPSLFVTGGHVMTCDNCHSLLHTNPYNGAGFHETEWRVPFVDLDVNWEQKTPAEICTRTRSNLSTTLDRLTHFNGDARLFWAMEDAMTPWGRQLSKAFPVDNFQEWTRRANNWTLHFAPCP